MTTRAAVSRTNDRRPRGAPRPPGSPDLEGFVRVAVLAYLEVRGGWRPLAQVAPLLAPALVQRLSRDTRSARAWAPRRVRRIVLTWPSDRACEATVLVDHDGRCTAIAVRAEHHHGSWRIVELAAPEDGRPALRTGSNPVAPRQPDAFDLVLDRHAIARTEAPP